MTSESVQPIIFLAFANDRQAQVENRYLRNLPEEARRLQSALTRAQDEGLCRLVVRQNATLDDILDVFQHPDHRNRIAVFHYGGHATSYELLFETEEGRPAAADADGLAAFLGHQTGLELVFLNGCSTQRQARGLLDAGALAVVATSQAIDDAVATNFAGRFYQGLAGGATIGMAFKEAEAAVQTAQGRNREGDARGFDVRNLYPADAREGFLADRLPWDLYLREGAEGAADWNLPDAADNPLFGLPSLPDLDLPERPYRHLKWYRREDAALFFGRGREIRDLYERVTAERTAPLVLFYGQAGVGKSSLLAAGLLPRLERDHAIRYARREQARGLLGTLAAALDAGDPGDLAAAWRAIEARRDRPLVVVLDQVEEVYSRPSEALPDELAVFLHGLGALFADARQRPRGKLILSFRKEWLAEIEKQVAEHKLPRTQVFLQRLERRGIVEVITGPARGERLRRHYGLEVEEALPGLVADDLLADRDSPVAPTLQILLSKMWEGARQRDFDHPRFDGALYTRLRRQGLGLDDFLEQQLATLGRQQPEAVASGLALDLLAHHTTPLGTAEQRAMADLEAIYRHRAGVLPGLVQGCQDLYLLVDPAENRPDRPAASRLAHDTLAPLVRKHFDESDLPGQRARRILENRAVDCADEQSCLPLDGVDLAAVEEGRAGMRAWTPAEEQLVAASRVARERRRRNRRIWQGVGLLAVVAILIALAVAMWQRQAANEQARIATMLGLASEAFVEMEERADLAVLLAVEALNQYNSVEAQNSLLRGLQSRPALRSTLRGHQDWVTSVAWHLDGTLLASVDITGTIQFWDAATGQAWREPLATGQGWVDSVAWQPDGMVLASAGGDGTVRLWDANTGQPLGELRGHEVNEHGDGSVVSVAWRPDGRILASGGADGTVRLWDVATGQPLGDPLRGHKDWVTSVTWRPDGTLLASAGLDGTLRLWDAATLRALGEPLVTGQNRVNGVAWSPDGTALASAGEDGTVRLWNADTGQPLIDPLRGHDGPVLSVAWSSDSILLASADWEGIVRLWDMVTGDLRGELPHGYKIEVSSVAWQPDGRVLASAGGDGIVRLWDLAAEQTLGELLPTEQLALETLAWSPDGALLALAGWDGKLQFWDAATNQARGEPLDTGQDGVWSVAWRPGGMVLASAGGDGTVRLWDAGTGQPLLELRGHEGSVSSVAWRPDGLVLASGGADGTVRLWDADRGQPLGEPLRSHEGPVSSLAWRPDGALLASAGEDGTVRLWDAGTGQPLRELRDRGWGWVQSLAWRPDGAVLAAAGGDDWGSGVVWLWDADAGQLLLEPLRGHKAPVSSVAWRPDGALLASGSEDGTVQLWDTVKGRPVGRSFLAGRDVKALAWHPDRAVLASGSSDGVVWLWDLDPTSWQCLACRTIGRNLTQAEWTRYVGPEVPYRCTCRDQPPGDGAPQDACDQGPPAGG